MTRMRVNLLCLVGVVGLVGLVGLVGCGDKEKDKQPDNVAKPTDLTNKPSPQPANKPGPSPFPDLKVSVNGTAVPIHSVHAYWVGEEAVKVEFSSVARGCNTHPTMRRIAKGERYFKVWFGKQLTPAGKASWAIVQSYFSGSTHQGSRDTVTTVTASPRAIGSHVVGTLQLKQKGFPRRNQPAAEIDIKGPFKAVNCRVPPSKGRFAAREGDMVLEIAGVKTKVIGANVKTHGDSTRIELSTDARSCRRSAGLARAVLKLVLKKGQLKRAFLRGTWFPTQMTENTLKPGVVAIKLGSATDQGVPLDVKGVFKIAKYPIKLSGNVSALKCSKPAKKPTLTPAKATAK